MRPMQVIAGTALLLWVCDYAVAQSDIFRVDETVLVSNSSPSTIIRDVAALPDGGVAYAGFAGSGDTSGIPVTTPFLDNPDCQSRCGFLRVLNSDGSVRGTEIYPDSLVADLALTPDGNLIVAGRAACLLDTPNFSTPGAAVTDCREGGWVQKRQLVDLELLWGTYVPGVMTLDTFPALAVNGTGDVFLAGQAGLERLSPTPNALLDSIPNPFGGNIGYLVRVSADGSEIPFSTYIGGPDGSVFIDGIIVEGDRALIVGYSDLLEIIGAGAFRADADNFDGLALEVDTATGMALRLGRFDGGANDSFFSVTGDLDGDIFVSGQKEPSDLEFAVDAFQPASPNGVSGFVVRLDTQLSVADGTYYSGTGFDGLIEIETLPNGNLVAAGTTFSLDLPVPQGGLIDYPPNSLQVDFFNRLDHLVILTPDLNSVVYGTYFGGIVPDPISNGNRNLVSGLSVGPDGAIVVSGATNNRDFPVFANSTDVGADRGFFGYAIRLEPSNLTIDGPGLLPAVAVNSPYSVQLTPLGTSAGIFALEGGALPPGISLSDTGLIDGTPTNFEELVLGAGANNFPLNISLTDPGTGERTLRRFQLRVADILVLNTLTPRDIGMEGASYSTDIAVSGGIPPFVWGVDPTTLPGGLTATVLFNGLRISGTPTEAGSFSIAVTVTDESNQVDSATIPLQITAAAPPPSPPAPPPPPSSGGGGGGAIGSLPTALLLILFGVANIRQRGICKLQSAR
ncbi:MAG: Ig domain-containing protein [Pseudomonadota bacterium]